MRINTNTAAMNTYSRLTSAQGSQANSLAKLSSGLRINKAGDDAAGLSISEKMRNQISGLKQATRNAQDGISLIQTAEGALNETHSILNRMRDLTVQGANDTNSPEDLQAIQDEIVSLRDEIDNIAGTTKFNGKILMNGAEGEAVSETQLSENVTESDLVTAYNSVKNLTGDDELNIDEVKAALADTPGDITAVVTEYNDEKAIEDQISTDDINIETTRTFEDTDFRFQIGANATEGLDVSIGNMSSAGLGIDTINVTDGNTDDILNSLDSAIGSVSAQRANLGATQNRLEHTINNLTTTRENLSEANSRIRDVDMAEEMMEFTKNNILSQASTSMLAQANQMPQGVLQLLG